MSGDIPPFAVLVIFLGKGANDVAEYRERSFQCATQRLRLLTHGDNLHLRLAALGDSDGLAAFGDLVDQGEAARLEGRGIDLAVHGQIPSDHIIWSL